MAGFWVLLSTALFAQNPPLVAAPAAKHDVHIDLAFLGYREPSRAERLIAGEASVSLDFVDAKHLLLTFDPRKLVTRLPSCPRTHDDRMIHAAVLEIPSGRTVHEADWYVHDRRRYLWPLGDGRFLLRKLNDLYLVDSSLQEKLLVNPPREVVWLTVSADGKQIILETEKTPDTPKSSSANDHLSKKSKFQLDFVDAASGVSQQTIESGSLVHLNGAGTGYADVRRKGDLWLVRFGPSPTERKNIARVRSQCIPDVFYAAGNELLIGRCAASGSE
jgi:hypothetical protein